MADFKLTEEEENAFDNFVAEIIRGVGSLKEEENKPEKDDEDPEADTDFDDKKNESEEDDWEKDESDEEDDKKSQCEKCEADDEEMDEEDDEEKDESDEEDDIKESFIPSFKRRHSLNESCDDKDSCDEEDDEKQDESDEEDDKKSQCEKCEADDDKDDLEEEDPDADKERENESEDDWEKDESDEEDDVKNESDDEDEKNEADDEEMDEGSYYDGEDFRNDKNFKVKESDDEEDDKNESDEEDDEEDEEGDKVTESEFVEPKYMKDAMADAVALAKKWRNSPEGKKCLAKWGDLLVRAGWKINESMVEKTKKVTSQRVKAITESLNESMNSSKLFKSLNESESKELKEAFIQGVQKTVVKSSELVRKDVIKECEQYVNGKLIPSMTKSVDKYAKSQMMPTLHEQIDSYMKFAAKEVVNEMESQKLIVKSRQTKNLEKFVESLKDLCASQLKYVPENESIVDSLESSNALLESKVDELQMKNVQRKDSIVRLKKENYFLKNKPSGLSEAGEEKMKAAVMAIDESEYSAFKKAADKIMKSSLTESEKVKKAAISKQTSYIDDLVERTLQLSK